MDIGFQFDGGQLSFEMLARDLQHSSRPVSARESASNQKSVSFKLRNFVR